MHLTGPGTPRGELEANCRLVRAGKSAVISETSIRTPAGGEVARAYVTFNRVPGGRAPPAPATSGG